MEEVVSSRNAKAALKRVRRNGGSPGTDGMTVDELPEHLMKNWETLKAQLLEGSYQPQPVRKQEIPKSGGGVRTLGIPTAVDRLVQQMVRSSPSYATTWKAETPTSGWRRRPGCPPSSMAGSVASSASCNSSTGSAGRQRIGSCGSSVPGRSRPPVWPRTSGEAVLLNLNRPNPRMRTRMSGGVAGE